jgi:hypothetical protein
MRNKSCTFCAGAGVLLILTAGACLFAEGANHSHRALVPPARPSVPQVKNAPWVRNPITVQRRLRHGRGRRQLGRPQEPPEQYSVHGPILDQPAAALLRDLKSRGMLDDTLVVWTTEFGRMPTFQKGASGRDHNPKGFTVWLAGAGVKRGFSHGATDDFGYEAVEDVTTIYDLHATMLHLLGLDHERLTYYHNGTERRLTDVHGHVVREVLA